MTRAQGREIDAAIVRAQAGTGGRIAVRVVTEKDVDAFARAKTEFERRGMHRAHARNAALILVAPKARAYAVLGDRALHERVGDSFWQEVVDEMRPFFARNAIVDGIVHGVARVGDALRAHFPKDATT